MNFLECGKVNVPLGYVRSIAWNRRARTSQRTGGYEVARGFETTEVTVQCVFDEGICTVLGRSISEDIYLFEKLVTDRMDTPDTLRIGGYPIVPSLQFALTSCNITRVYDPAYSCALSCDLVFAGVKVSKEASRNRVMQFDESDAYSIPPISLEVNGKSLELKDAYRLSELKRTPDSLSFVCEISDDMCVADTEGFLTSLVEDHAKVKGDFDDGEIEYWVASASLDDNTLSVVASILPEKSQIPYVKTYWSSNMSDILTDLCRVIGIECSCKFADFKVDYFQNTDSPWDAIRALVNSAGLIMSWDRNSLLFVNVPDKVYTRYELEAQTTPDDNGISLYTGCVWMDGMNRHTTGDLEGETVHYHSVFRCSDKTPCKNCLDLARFYQRTVVIECPVNRSIVQHSCVTVNSNGTLLDGIVSEFEADYVSGNGRYEVGLV